MMSKSLVDEQTLALMEDNTARQVIPSAFKTTENKSEDKKYLQMLPPSGIPSKRNVKRKKVLEEEDYVDALSHIIERDYFPQLAATRPNSELQNDATGKIDKLSVGSFFEEFTSYDNDSFAELQEQSTEAHRRKYHWLYELPALEGEDCGKHRQSGMLMLYYLGDNVLSALQREKMDAILNGDEERVGDHRPNGVKPWRFRVRNQLMFPPELKASEDTCGMRNGLPVPAISDGTAGPVRSILPGAQTAVTPSALLLNETVADDKSKFNTSVNNIQALQRAVVRYNSRVDVSGGAVRSEKLIQRRNTAFTSTGSAPGLTAAQLHSWQQNYQSMQTVGRLCRIPGLPLEEPHTPSLRSSAASDTSSTVGDGEGRPKQYLPVPMSPCPVPGEGALGSLTPLFTWGDIEDSPLLLSGSSTSSTAPRPLTTQQIVTTGDSVRGHMKRMQEQALLEEEQDVPRFSLRPTSQRELIARSLDRTAATSASSSSKRARVHSSVREKRTNDRSTDVRRDYYRSLPTPVGGSDSSVRTSRSSQTAGGGARTGSTAQRLASMTPAARALALKLNKSLLATPM